MVHGNHHLQTHRFCWRTLRIHGANSAAKMAPRGVRLVNKRVVSCIKDLNPVSISMPTPMFAPILDLCLYLHLSLSLCLYLHRYLYLISSSKYINVCVYLYLWRNGLYIYTYVYIYLSLSSYVCFLIIRFFLYKCFNLCVYTYLCPLL